MNFKNYKCEILISVIVLLSLCVQGIYNALSSVNFPSWFVWLPTPGAAALILLVLFIYDKYLWKLPVLNLLCKVPDLNGRYEGEIQFSYDGEKRTKQCAIEIRQACSHIKARTYFQNGNREEYTQSENLLEFIEKNNSDEIFLHFYYRNSGEKMNGSELNPHDGFTSLKVISEAGKYKFIGNYFNDRGSQGVMEVNFKSKELKHKF